MQGFFSGKFKELFVMLLLFLVLITVNAVHRIEGKTRWYDEAVIYITAPAQYFVEKVIKGTGRFIQDYIFIHNVKSDNKKLLQENQKLTKKIFELTELGYENKRLRTLLSMKEKTPINMISAVVMAEDLNASFKSVRVDRGSEDGIQILMPVINNMGVIGQIISVYPKFSDVMLITDPNSAIDVIVQESRARGLLVGQGTGICNLKYLNRLDDVQVSYTVVTSGIEQRFPKGFVIGKVSFVDRKNYGVTQDVRVEPTVDLDKLEEVFIVRSPSL